MASRRGAHIGADGRWWAVPIRPIQRFNASQKRVVVGVVFAAAALLIFPAAGLFGNAAQTTSSIIILSFPLLLALAAVALFMWRAAKTAASRLGLGGHGPGLVPICATNDVIRVPLSEWRHSTKQLALLRDALDLNDIEEISLDGTVAEDLADIRNRTTDDTDSLQLARGCAALLRVIGLSTENLRLLQLAHLEPLARRSDGHLPRMWIIDDAVGVSPPSATLREHRSMRAEVVSASALRAWSERWSDRLFVGVWVATIVTLVVGISTSSMAAWTRGRLYAICILFSLFVLIGIVSTWMRPRWRLLVSAGRTTLNRMGVEDPNAKRLEPAHCVAVAYIPSVQTWLGSTLREKRVVWRFLFAEEPYAAEVDNFDYRGTAWEPLMEEFFERQRQVADMGPPEGN